MSGPVKHIVMWRLRGDTPEERAAARLKVKTAFEGLKGLIDGLNHIEVGVDVSNVDYACDVVLVSEFANMSDLTSYATHPEHLRVRRELGDLRIDRHQVDYPIDAAEHRYEDRE
ncbi:Dabb family protein [Bosea vaviloviae]|uniref:Stress responsive protein n=1 Tax=Bosea vaviloviae TaxID=1526658 RepID=A0A1D7UC11_9HYPH|nr:Dabb family protein [Bosea vaviloviae]AOO84911.1 stress responsive protein [Bosea vaviloviae]